MAKKKPLTKEQKVWLEVTGNIGYGKSNEELKEMVVVKSNGTTAYIWYSDRTFESSHFKVNQNTHQVKYAIPDGRTYRLWLSKEEYKNFTELESEKKILLEKAHEKISNMSLEELRLFTSKK